MGLDYLIGEPNLKPMALRMMSCHSWTMLYLWSKDTIGTMQNCPINTCMGCLYNISQGFVLHMPMQGIIPNSQSNGVQVDGVNPGHGHLFLVCRRR